MLGKKISSLVLVAAITSSSMTPLNVFADSLIANSVIQESQLQETSQVNVSKFDIYYSQFRETYDKVFKMDNSNIESVVSIGGNLRDSVSTKNMLDGNLDTYWETGRHTSSSFNNELIFTLKEETELNRIAYRSAWNTVGFAENFEIWASATEQENDFQLVGSAQATKTADVVEIKFEKTNFKRLKFVFKNTGTATASEMMFYKEDMSLDKANSLFTDSTMSKVSEEFNDEDKINKLEEKFKSHPLYSEYKENFENARALLKETNIESTEAKVSKFTEYYTNNIEAYDKVFKIDNSNISSIVSTGGRLNANVGTEKITDGKLDTYWETGKHTSDSFNNELIFTFKESIELNRIAYRSAWNTVGFAENFEIWASTTTKGDTFKLVSSAQATKTADVVEIKFNNTNFKRLKFVFKNKGTATTSEMMFYKEDNIKDKFDRIFTDSQKNQVSEEFNTLEKINELEKEAKKHPLYDTMKEDIDNAKIILENSSFDYADAKVSTFLSYNDEKLNTYDELFRVKRENITSITTNGSQYAHNSIDRAIDGDISTQWHSGKQNSNDFTNEIVITLDRLTTIDRITYLNKVSRGFAQEFDIYASKTSTGDTFEKISSGTSKITTDNLEIKFKPTELRRIKLVFKKGYENWAIAYEIGLYKEDKVRDAVNRLFTTTGMDTVSEEFNTVEKITELEEEAKKHPLYDLFKDNIEEAKEIVSGKIQNIKTVVAEQQGDRVAHAKNNLKIGLGNNNQPTGVVAMSGETITVYVDMEEGKPAPKLFFSQQEGSWANWGKTVQLKAGKNEIEVPQVTQNDGWYHHSVTPGGPIYIVNPYTEEEQGKAPTIRFAKGVQTFPIFDKNANEESFIEFLKEYKAKLDEDAKNNPDVMDRKMIDTFELVADHVVLTFTASSAYEAYIKGDFTPSKTLNMYNDHLDMLFKYQGLDGSNEKNDIKYTRENIRLAQPYGFMYAAGSHTGVQSPQLVGLLTTVGGWGIDHEIGHRMDIGVRELGEITNNMLPQKSANYYNSTAENRIPYESHVYKNVIGIGNNEYSKGGYFENLAVFWQLEMVYPGYWAKLNKIYRENDIKVSDQNDKLDKLAYYSSMAVEADLTEYFERHGFPITDTTKEFASNYNKPEKKIWYANETYSKYTGEGFTSDPNVEVSTSKQGENIKVSFNVDETYKDDVMGYEVYRNGELVAFTSTNSFVDTKVSYNDNVIYKVVPFDKKLNEGKVVEVSSYKPVIEVQQEEVTLKLREEFDPKEIVQAHNYKGEDISSEVKVNHNIDVNQKGDYEITYSVTDENITTEKVIKVTVVSDYEYLADYEWESVATDYGTPRKNNNIKGRVNGEIKTFEKGFGIHANGKIMYDLSDNDYDTFEALLGVDMGIAAQNNSSITFKVVGDGKTLATTKVIKHADNMVYVNVPVKGINNLTIEVHDGGNGISSDHAVIANPKLTTSNAKPKLTIGKNESVKIRDKFDLMSSVKATDAEDGDLTKKVVLNSNGFDTNKTGIYTLEYSVTDNDGNTVRESKQVVVYSDTKYLSDLNWESATIGSGSVRKDRAVNNNIMKLLNEDNTIETFNKGIGTHSYSEIVYDSNGYEVFDSWVGVDRNITANTSSSVVFKVYVDGELKAQSDVMRYNTPKQHLVVDVRNSKKVKLVVDVADNGNTWDHANWADAKFLVTNTEPKLNIPKSVSTKVGHKINLDEEYSAYDIEDGDLTSDVKVSGEVNFDRTGEYELTYTVVDSDGNKVTKTRTVAVVNMDDFDYLTDFYWKSETHNYTVPRKDISISSKALRLTDEKGKEVSYSRGIGAHSTSTVVYDLSDKNYDYFTSYVGVDRQMYGTVGSVSFEVYVDGEKKFDSGLMNSTDKQKHVEVDINGAKELKLVVTDGGNGNGSDHGVWGDTKLHYAKEGTIIDRSKLDELINIVNELKAEIYTVESFEKLQTVLENTNVELEDGYNQEEIDTHYANLKDAYDQLIKSTDFSSLEEVIGNNSNYNELHYFRDDMKAHKAVIEEAKTVLDNKEATQEEVNKAIAKVIESAKKLVIRNNKVELEKKLEEAKAIKNNNYDSARWHNFSYAIIYAQDIYNNIDASDQDITSALFMLQYCQEELK